MTYCYPTVESKPLAPLLVSVPLRRSGDAWYQRSHPCKTQSTYHPTRSHPSIPNHNPPITGCDRILTKAQSTYYSTGSHPYKPQSVYYSTGSHPYKPQSVYYSTGSHPYKSTIHLLFNAIASFQNSIRLLLRIIGALIDVIASLPLTVITGYLGRRAYSCSDRIRFWRDRSRF